MITHAKSSYLIGNNYYAITYFQKEYPSNFLYPSIYYLVKKFFKFFSLENTQRNPLIKVLNTPVFPAFSKFTISLTKIFNIPLITGSVISTTIPGII